MRAPKSLHPLLLEPTYWRSRLLELERAQDTLHLRPRPELSIDGREVVEFRVQAHDGVGLVGLLARPTAVRSPGRGRDQGRGEHSAHIRMVGPCEALEVDPSALARGNADIVFQEHEGRRLGDRVLDVVRICQLAFGTEGVDPEQVRFVTPRDGREPDEFLIAKRLLEGRLA